MTFCVVTEPGPTTPGASPLSPVGQSSSYRRRTGGCCVGDEGRAVWSSPAGRESARRPTAGGIRQRCYGAGAVNTDQPAVIPSPVSVCGTRVRQDLSGRVGPAAKEAAAAVGPAPGVWFVAMKLQRPPGRPRCGGARRRAGILWGRNFLSSGQGGGTLQGLIACPQAKQGSTAPKRFLNHAGAERGGDGWGLD